MTYRRTQRVVLILLLVWIALPASAAVLRVASLPSSLATELASGAVAADFVDGALQSFASHGGFSAYRFDRGGTPFALITYDALPGSRWYTTFGGSQPLGGMVFVEAPLDYTTSETAQFNLYFDSLVPGIPPNAFWSNQPQTSLVLQPDAMADGFGVYEFSGDPDYVTSGNMNWATFGDQPFTCIECQFFARFDLVFLDYSNGILEFDFDDPRTTLFTGYDAFDVSPYTWGLEIVVNPIPLPPALALFAAALGLLGVVRRDRSRSTA